jgi:hypothetical protein
MSEQPGTDSPDCVSFLIAIGSGLCVFSDRKPPMEQRPAVHTAQLPTTVNRARWRTGAWTHAECVAHCRSHACERKCHERTQVPPAAADKLLRKLRAGLALWFGLRRHLSVADATFILNVLVEHSQWHQVKRSRNEDLRREYLQYYDECRYFDREWVPRDMHTRQAAEREQAAQDTKP